MQNKTKSDHKYKSWVMTIFIPDGNTSITRTTFELVISEYADKYAFQIEVTPTTGKEHLQVAFLMTDRKRQSTIINFFAKELAIDKEFITVDRMYGTWEESLSYVTKNDSRKDGELPVVSTNVVVPYRGQDLDIVSSPETRFPWQNELLDMVFEGSPLHIQPASDREVHWIVDRQGCSGKSLFVKYLCFNNEAVKKISFGTSNQLRSGVIDAGPAKVYVVDLPRTLGKEDHLNNIITVIEDLKSGFVVSNFHGKSRQLMIMPPHVIVFANFPAPLEKLSSDRWVVKEIIRGKELVTVWQ